MDTEELAQRAFAAANAAWMIQSGLALAMRELARRSGDADALALFDRMISEAIDTGQLHAELARHDPGGPGKEVAGHMWSLLQGLRQELQAAANASPG